MKNDQKLTFSKNISSDHKMSTSVFKSVLETQTMCFEPLNILVNIFDDGICYFLQDEKIVKITIFT